ncbi:MAG: HigA family addiction module antitoxin [Alphaproteobacteria bacterium]|jgi:addiction module HigA family antidote|nr:HigA family addiction module antitoxin [Alphaproteobacteria bacterium]
MKAKRAPIHPGEHLAEDFMVPFGLSARKLARALYVPANRISAIVAGKRAVTPDTALRLAKYFGTTAEFWMNLQKNYEIQLAEDEARDSRSKLHGELAAIEPISAASRRA